MHTASRLHSSTHVYAADLNSNPNRTLKTVVESYERVDVQAKL